MTSLADPQPTTLVTLDPRHDLRWRMLAARPQSSVFTSPPWISAVCDTYGFAAAARVELDAAGEPLAGLAWVGVSDLRGDRLIGLPFSDRAEPFACSTEELRRLTDAIVGPTAPFTVRCLSPAAELFDERFRRTGEAMWHGTPLHDDPLTRISGHARRNVAHSHRAGVHVEAREDLAAVRVLHDLHVDLRRHKYGLLAQPFAFFEAIWAAFAPCGEVVTLLATKDGSVIAGALLLAWNDVVYYKFGASRLDALAARPNDAIFHTALRWATERGARLVDWGLSDDDQPGLIAFKDKWASDRGRVVTLRAGGETSRTSPEAGALLGELTRLLVNSSVPTETTRRAGELLYRYFC